jgi:hypothetical protein
MYVVPRKIWQTLVPKINFKPNIVLPDHCSPGGSHKARESCMDHRHFTGKLVGRSKLQIIKHLTYICTY